MAKTTAPLMSMVASGAFGKSMTFDKRGFVRKYTVPANPKSHDQGDARQKLAAVQAVLKGIQASAVTAIKAVAPTGYRWNSWALGQIIGADAAVINASLAEYGNLSSENKAAWVAAFPTITVPSISYKTMGTVTAGAAAYIVARGLFLAGVLTGTGAPSGTNSSSWHTALIGS